MEDDAPDDRWAKARREAVRFPADLFAYPPAPAPSASAEVVAAWLRECRAEIAELREGLVLALRYGDEDVAAPWRRAIAAWEARCDADLSTWRDARPGVPRPG